MSPLRLLPWLLLLGLLVACTPPPDTVLRFGVASEPSNLDPRFATDAISARVNRLLYARLVDFDAQSRPVPALAVWQRLGPTHYRFTLGSSGRRFHDGSAVTAKDVAATYRSVLDPATASPHRGALRLIDSIEVLDEDRLDFQLARPDPLFPAYLVIGIVPAAALAQGHPLHSEPIGSGELRFVGRPEAGRMRLQRVHDAQVIELVQVKDPTVRVLKLLRGEIDFLQNDLPAELIAYLERQPELRVRRQVGSFFAYIGFNLQDPATGQLAVRRAIAHAIDREAVIRHVLSDAARPAAAVLTPRHWAGHPDLHAITHDRALARHWLQKAGYGPERPLRLQYKTSADPLRLRIATVFQHQLAQVGIEVDLHSHDWGTFYGDIKAGRFQLYSLAWVGIKTPDIFRYAFHSESLPPEGANRGRLADAEVDRLILNAEAATSLAAQAQAYRDLQERLLELLPYVPLWYEDHVFVARRDIQGYPLASDGNYDGLRSVLRTRAPTGEAQ